MAEDRLEFFKRFYEFFLDTRFPSQVRSIGYDHEF